MGDICPKIFSCPLVSPQIISNVLKSDQIWWFQHKNCNFFCVNCCLEIPYFLAPPPCTPKCWCWYYHCEVYKNCLAIWSIPPMIVSKIIEVLLHQLLIFTFGWFESIGNASFCLRKWHTDSGGIWTPTSWSSSSGEGILVWKWCTGMCSAYDLFSHPPGNFLRLHASIFHFLKTSKKFWILKIR